MPHVGELADLQSATSPITAVAVGASPFTYTAPSNGYVSIQGGIVTQVELGRNGAYTLAGSTKGVVPVRKGDQVKITYSGWWPVVSFMKG